mmetsp:Transcript_27154/g.50907  ORF Transcript_27154/g.50907 Transcript_27154/m.50907 type:complete len:226 (-) Transcript_27154:351-1028(-)
MAPPRPVRKKTNHDEDEAKVPIATNDPEVPIVIVDDLPIEPRNRPRMMPVRSSRPSLRPLRSPWTRTDFRWKKSLPKKKTDRDDPEARVVTDQEVDPKVGRDEASNGRRPKTKRTLRPKPVPEVERNRPIVVGVYAAANPVIVPRRNSSNDPPTRPKLVQAHHSTGFLKVVEMAVKKMTDLVILRLAIMVVLVSQKVAKLAKPAAAAPSKSPKRNHHHPKISMTI